MLRFAGVLLLTVWSSLAADAPREVQYGRRYWNDPLPLFDKGYLIFMQVDSAQIEVWGPNGQMLFTAAVENPHAASVATGAVAPNGSVVVGIAYAGASYGYAGGLVVFDHSGKQTRFLPTDRFVPSHLAFDREGTLWALGWQRSEIDNSTADVGDYRIVRRYDRDLKETGAFAGGAMFPERLQPGGFHGGRRHLLPADEHIGAIVFTGKTGGVSELLEVSGATGAVLGHWPMGRDTRCGYAYTSKGELWRAECAEGSFTLSSFHRENQKWQPQGAVPTFEPGQYPGLLLGADGEDLGFRHRRRRDVAAAVGAPSGDQRCSAFGNLSRMRSSTSPIISPRRFIFWAKP